MGDSLSGSCEWGTTVACGRGWHPTEGPSFWATPAPVDPGCPWVSDRLGRWRLCPQMEASSDNLRPPGECLDPLWTVLHRGVWQSFLQRVTTTVARITAKHREIPTTTTMLPPMAETPTDAEVGDDVGNTGGGKEESYYAHNASIFHFTLAIRKNE